MYQISNKFFTHKRDLLKVILSKYIFSLLWTIIEITFSRCVFENVLSWSSHNSFRTQRIKTETRNGA